LKEAAFYGQTSKLSLIFLSFFIPKN
jgi:hypothetical protein